MPSGKQDMRNYCQLEIATTGREDTPSDISHGLDLEVMQHYLVPVSFPWRRFLQ